MFEKWLLAPLFDIATDGGGGEVVDDGSQAPEPVELSDDSMVRIKGEKEPLKWKDYSGRYVPKSEFTQKTQTYSQQLKERDQQIAQYKQQLEQRQQAGQGNTPQARNELAELVKAISSKPYISGQEAAQLVGQVWQNGVQNLQNAISQRDQLLQVMWQKLQTVDGTVSGLNSQSRDAAFKAKLAGWKQDLALPDDPVVDEFLQDIYLSHEGEDLDQEFPNIAKSRFEALQKLVNAANKQRVDAAKAKGFQAVGQKQGAVFKPAGPRKGGGFKDAKQMADDLWASLQGGDT